MSIFRIRKLALSESKESLMTYLADVIADSREIAMFAAQTGKVSNWRLSTVLAVRSVYDLPDVGPVCQYVGKIDVEHAIDPQRPRTEEDERDEKRQRMKEVVERIQLYCNTYDNQHGYLDYEDHTFIEDMLYGIAIALEPEKYKFSPGFRRFKIRLAKDHIQPLVGDAEDIMKGFEDENEET